MEKYVFMYFILLLPQVVPRNDTIRNHVNKKTFPPSLPCPFHVWDSEKRRDWIPQPSFASGQTGRKNDTSLFPPPLHAIFFNREKKSNKLIGHWRWTEGGRGEWRRRIAWWCCNRAPPPHTFCKLWWSNLAQQVRRHTRFEKDTQLSLPLFKKYSSPSETSTLFLLLLLLLLPLESSKVREEQPVVVQFHSGVEVFVRPDVSHRTPWL